MATAAAPAPPDVESSTPAGAPSIGAPAAAADGSSPATARRTFGTAVERWASVGPYYAMFPIDFAFNVVGRHAAKGSAVLDPFAGRGTSVYAAAASGRPGLGIEINPVGWLYGTVKLRPASKLWVLSRLTEIATAAGDRAVGDAAAQLPPFFAAAYAPGVRRFLIAARDVLAWRTSHVDRTLMAFILVYLHGKHDRALSNQMRDGKAMSPDYAVAWWKERAMSPPDVDPVAFLTKRIEWRYKYGAPALDGTVRLGDSVEVLVDLRRRVERGRQRRFGLLFTSPPYMGVTNYHYDQWLRLWMLGGRDRPESPGGQWQGKFESRANYTALLEGVFGAAAPLLTRGATVYVRTDAREFTRQTTVDTLTSLFPRKKLTAVERPLTKRSQTALFGDTSKKPGEIDLLLTT